MYQSRLGVRKGLIKRTHWCSHWMTGDFRLFQTSASAGITKVYDTFQM
jgi:hypothetical protein